MSLTWLLLLIKTIQVAGQAIARLERVVRGIAAAWRGRRRVHAARAREVFRRCQAQDYANLRCVRLPQPLRLLSPRPGCRRSSQPACCPLRVPMRKQEYTVKKMLGIGAEAVEVMYMRHMRISCLSQDPHLEQYLQLLVQRRRERVLQVHKLRGRLLRLSVP